MKLLLFALPLLRLLLAVLLLSPVPASAQVITEIYRCAPGTSYCTPEFFKSGGRCHPSTSTCYRECLVNGERVIGPAGGPAVSRVTCEVDGIFELHGEGIARECLKIAHVFFAANATRSCGEILRNYLVENFPPAPPKSDDSNKALIAGGIAIAAIAAWKFLAPELPDGASFRPHANVGFRKGTAFTTAGLSAEWRNWRLSAASAHNGRGWSRPLGHLDWRVQWEF